MEPLGVLTWSVIDTREHHGRGEIVLPSEMIFLSSVSVRQASDQHGYQEVILSIKVYREC